MPKLLKLLLRLLALKPSPNVADFLTIEPAQRLPWRQMDLGRGLPILQRELQMGARLRVVIVLVLDRTTDQICRRGRTAACKPVRKRLRRRADAFPANCLGGNSPTCNVATEKKLPIKRSVAV